MPQKKKPATNSRAPPVTIPAAGFHSVSDVAILPLLKQFQVIKPQSPLIQAIINEQQAADTVNAIQKQEEKLRNELKKECAKQEDDEKDNANGTGNANANATNGPSLKKKSSKKAKSKSKAESKKIADLEGQIDTLSKAYAQARQQLDQHTYITYAAIQAHYTNVATKLDPDHWGESLRGPYEALVEAFDYLQNVEKRLVYAREMIPVMKAVGEPKKATEVIELPYIQLFHTAEASSPIVQALIHELHQLSITEELRKRITDMDMDQKRLIKDAQEMQERQTAKTSELIRKHYRRKSIKLHPDRNGESFRNIFEDFTDARDVLSDEKLRQLYLKQMLAVFHTFGKGYMDSSHKSWISKNRPDKAEANFKSTRTGRAQEGKPLKLEGGLHHQTPKGPILQHKDQQVTVSIHALRPVHEFYSRVRSIRVEFTSTEDETYSIDVGRADIVKNIKHDRRGAMYGNLIQVGSALMNAGHWEVFWYATLDTVGTDPLSPHNATYEKVQTKSSAVASFHVGDQDFKAKLDRFRKAEETCKIVKWELQNTVDRLKTQESISRYGFHHKVLVRAGKKIRNLKWAMKETDKKSDIYDSLYKLLEASRQVFSELEDHLESATKRKEKKDSLKNFKAFVAGVLESADPTYWMMEVIEATLKNEGGDSNRLYQLFIEGKGKYVLMVDSDMYEEASLRNDLFSPKQCKELASRGKAMQAQEAKEEEEAIAAEAQRILEEEKLKRLEREAELRKKWAMVGNTVTIDGLTSVKGKILNSSAARVLDYSIDKDRFEVLCVETGEKAYLKEDNFSIYYYGNHAQPPQSSAPKDQPVSSESWDCTHCTFKNSAENVECSMCFNPRKLVSISDHREGDEDKGTVETVETSYERVATNSGSTDEDDLVEKKTIFVVSSHSKRLTGKKGRKKNDLMSRSGADIQIETKQVAGGRVHVPVHLTGSKGAVQKATVLVQEVVGLENICDDIDEYLSTSLEKSSIIEEKQTAAKTDFDIFPVISNPIDDIRDVSIAEFETKSGAEHSFGDALLPQGMIEMPLQMPSEIGIKRHLVGSIGMPRESMTDASVSSLADRSQASRTYSRGAKSTNISFHENDPLLVFLRTQHHCIKGNVEEFFKWLVKSEDIDSMDALKEAVSDDDYLHDSMQVGNGSVGLKGFKRKAFQRSVFNYGENNPFETFSSSTRSDRPDTSSNDASRMHGIEANAFLPPNLFDGTDVVQDNSKVASNNHVQVDEDPPNDLYCPIDRVLMTEDPVLAADGVTYEREAIERWFQIHMAEVIMAEEKLKMDPHLQREQEIVNNGIRSPVYAMEMPNLCLTANTSIKNMARAHTLRTEKRKAVNF